MTIFFILQAVNAFSQGTQAHERLTNLEHFVRCYSKFTLQAPKITDPLYIAVKNGSMNPVTACMNLLKKATMTGTETNLTVPSSVLNASDGAVVSEIVRNFHNFHKSWFPSKLRDGSAIDQVTHLIRDFEEPPLYLTRALFGQVGNNKVQFKTAVTYNKSLAGLRYKEVQPNISNWDSRSFFSYPTIVDNEPSNITFNFLNLPLGTLNSPSNTTHHTTAIQVPDNQLVQFGELYGVRDAPALNVSKVRYALNSTGRGSGSDINNTEIQNSMMTTNFQSRNLREHLGGGIIGSQSFYLANTNLVAYQPAYRERVVARRYTSRIQEILMCHTMPNLLPSDVAREVNLNSEHAFQQNASCMQCHSAIDPAAGVVKNLIVFTTANQTNSLNRLRLGIPAVGAGRLPAGSSAQDYVFTTPSGRLYYRDFKNKLVSQNISSLADMGNKIGSSFDYYACASKRYYYFLTGIDVTLNSIEGESSLTQYHRSRIFSFAERLQSHQNLMTLIQDIISSDTFKTRNYMSEQGGD